MIAGKNINNILKWTAENPDYINSDSRQNDKYLKIVSNSMNGLTEEEQHKNLHKIVLNVAKEIIIDK